MTHNLLVVGGSRFVGSAVVRRFLAAGHTVSVLNRGSRPIEGVRQLVADRTDAAAMRATLAGERFDAVVDTSCYGPDTAGILLDALPPPCRRVVAVSSAAVYGHGALQPPDEDQPTGGASVWGAYGRDKSAMEDVWVAAATGAFARLDHCALVRPPYVCGPGNPGNRETWFWARQAAGRPVPLPGRGAAKVQFIHVDDLADAIHALATGDRRGCEIFNVADPQVLDFRQLATLLAEAAGLPDRAVWVGAAPAAEPVRAWFPFLDYPCLTPPAKLMRELGWAPGADLRTRFEQTYATYSAEALSAFAVPSPAEPRV